MRGPVHHRARGHADLFRDLAAHGVFQGLARLDKTRDRGKAGNINCRAPGQQAAFTIDDQGNDGRIGAGKMQAAAFFIQAPAGMTGPFHHR